MKRLLCLTLISVFLLTILCFSASAWSFVRGDADTDGKVSVIDATAIQKVRASMQVDPFNEVAADVDDDGIVSVLDATFIQKALAHIEVPYAIGDVVTIETEAPTDSPTEPQTEPSTVLPVFKPSENELPFIPNT